MLDCYLAIETDEPAEKRDREKSLFATHTLEVVWPQLFTYARAKDRKEDHSEKIFLKAREHCIGKVSGLIFSSCASLTAKTTSKANERHIGDATNRTD